MGRQVRLRCRRTARHVEKEKARHLFPRYLRAEVGGKEVRPVGRRFWLKYRCCEGRRKKDESYPDPGPSCICCIERGEEEWECNWRTLPRRLSQRYRGGKRASPTAQFERTRPTVTGQIGMLGPQQEEKEKKG